MNCNALHADLSRVSEVGEGLFENLKMREIEGPNEGKREIGSQ